MRLPVGLLDYIDSSNSCIYYRLYLLLIDQLQKTKINTLLIRYFISITYQKAQEGL